MYPPAIADFANQTDFTTMTSFTSFSHQSSGQNTCSRKDCEVRRMYLTWETFGTTWFPILFALGVYCLIDGLFQTFTFFFSIMLLLKIKSLQRGRELLCCRLCRFFKRGRPYNQSQSWRPRVPVAVSAEQKNISWATSERSKEDR